MIVEPRRYIDVVADAGTTPDACGLRTDNRTIELPRQRPLINQPRPRRYDTFGNEDSPAAAGDTGAFGALMHFVIL
jgi:hypothetical protein